jgi:type II secretory pathway component HofQ
MVTPVVSEEGSILIDEDTNVVFQFKNLSKLMKLKLKIATMVLDK